MRVSQLSLLLGLTTALSAPIAAQAQEAAWLQIEAHRSIAEAEAAARRFAAQRQNVTGFALSTGWYAVALGPYSREDAGLLLNRLKAAGAIPRDSYVTDGGIYRGQFWPPGASTPQDPLGLPGANQAPSAEVEAPSAPAPAPENAAPTPDPLRSPDEDVAAARASEAALDRAAKQDLQVALKWAGHYNGAIDGLYGPGTRASMAAWQEEQRYPPTGVLTTAQRQEVIAAYNAILDGMDLQVIQDDAAGIRMAIPTGVVAFDAYEPPFVRFTHTGDINAQMLLISQEGNEETLTGLYEIMQTLEIVPTEGPRRKDGTSFVLEGVDDTVHSHTEARLEEGKIKGFSLIWPAGDEARRSRVLDEMRKSFIRIGGVLDPAIAPPNETQATDLVSGLAVRKPLRTRTGTYLDDQGSVLTSAEAVQDCQEIEMDGGISATLVYSDADIAVLRPTAPLSPRAHATFRAGVPRLQSRIALAGFPFDGILPRATMTFGTLEDLRSLDGDTRIDRLTLMRRPSETGGPIFDNAGLVIGMLLPPAAPDGKQLPSDVAFSLDSGAIAQILESQGISMTKSDQGAYETEERITEEAGKMTVMVRCWE